MLHHEESGFLVGGHDLVDLGSVVLDFLAPMFDLLLGARTWLVSDVDDLAGLLASGDSVLESESVFSQLGESLGVLGGDDPLSVEGDLDSPSVDGLGGAAARLLHVVDSDDDSAGLLASGDSVVQDSDVVVGSVGGDDRVPGPDLLLDVLARAWLLVNHDDSLAGLLADGPSLVPDLQALLIVSVNLQSDDGDLLVVLLDLVSPLVDVLGGAAARLVLDNDDRSAGAGASDDSGSEDVLVLDQLLDLDLVLVVAGDTVSVGNGDSGFGVDSLDSQLQSVDSGGALVDSDSRGRESADCNDVGSDSRSWVVDPGSDGVGSRSLAGSSDWSAAGVSDMSVLHVSSRSGSGVNNSSRSGVHGSGGRVVDSSRSGSVVHGSGGSTAVGSGSSTSSENSGVVNSGGSGVHFTVNSDCYIAQGKQSYDN